ncbi:MAG TPA: AraC family transcriptional regulator [Planctomycetota bacterium]|jgi:AraC-like DNA-binding protein|nr:AraC family transcriptional regulator [Planctomycetota bacterium]
MPKLWLPSPGAQDSPALAVHGVGVREDMDRLTVDRPHGTQECLVMCFHHEVPVWLDGRLQTAPAGHSVLWTPHQKHFFGRTDRLWSHTWMYADGALAEELIGRAPEFLTNRLLPPSTEPIVLRYIELIYDELLRNAPPDPFVCERLFELLIREMTRAVRPSATSQPVPAVFQAVRQFIEANLHRRLYLAELAGVAHLSISRFSGEFHRWFGLAPMQYLHRQRMRRAALMLLDNHRRVSDVAFALGFDDPLYFSRQFTLIMGENPTAYRQRRQGQIAQ